MDNVAVKLAVKVLEQNEYIDKQSRNIKYLYMLLGFAFGFICKYFI